MNTPKLSSIGLIAIMVFTFSQQTSAQLVDFYSSPGYTTMINNLITNHIWNSSMETYTKNSGKQNTGGSGVSKPRSSSQSSPPIVPDYRKYPAVQFKSTGTSLILQQELEVFEGSPQEKAEAKKSTLEILNKYETAAAAKGYPNDWALAYVSYVGLNSHVYNGNTEKPIIPFYQNEGLRDVVAKYATDFAIFNNFTDRKKQELYELLVILGGITYNSYEKALRENNAEELKAVKLYAANNLKLMGLKP